MDARKRRVGLIVIGTVAGLVIALVASAMLMSSALSADATSTPNPAKTNRPSATVERGTLQGTTKEPGSLGRAQGPTVQAGRGGVLTELPAVGTELGASDTLYRSDNRPVVGFEGTLPQWRAFEDGMSDGADVKQLEEQLWNWNHLKEYPTDHFDVATTLAIKSWQKATGQESTGRIGNGEIAFVSGRFVVSAQRAAIGDRVNGGPLYETVRTGVTITVDLPVGSPLARGGRVVEVSLPNGKREPGKVERVDAATDDAEGESVLPTTVVLDDPAALGELTGGSVVVEFVSEVRKDVLSVPILALSARADGGFELEVLRRDDTTVAVAVETGLFADDRVEVRGKTIAEGDRVVVPKA